jgi:hypothetical protein
VEFIATIRYLKKKGYEESKYYCWKMNEDKDIKYQMQINKCHKLLEKFEFENITIPDD